MPTNPIFTLAMQAGAHESAYVEARATAMRANAKAFEANQRSQASTERLAAAIVSASPPLTVETLTTVLGVALNTAAETRTCPPAPPLPDGTGRVTVEFIIGPISDKPKGPTPMFVLKATQRLPLTLSVKDKEQNQAQIDGVPVWSLSDPKVGDLQVAADGKSAVLLAGTPNDDGTPFTGSVGCACDADLGEGVTTIGTTFDITIVAGDAAVVMIEPGTPEEQ